jgi:thiamine-monophosphate kinase
MNEFELIDRLRPGLPGNDTTLVGAGDDCAVLDPGLPGRWLLFKTDAVVEGIHFEPSTDPARIGHKALARCLSDVAAMAGTPTHAVITLALPSPFDPARVEGIYAGLNALAARHRVAIVGGETTTNPERLLISVALLGTVPRGRCPLRSGARAGDVLLVTGTLGGAVRSGRHLDFEPRLEEARWLADQFEVHALIDLSDGLARDLRQILKASGVGAELWAEAIPISPAARTEPGARAAAGWPAPLVAALTDGEDFELLFTLPATRAGEVEAAWAARFDRLPLSRIGRIRAEPGLVVRDRDGVRPLTLDGYVHFQQP